MMQKLSIWEYAYGGRYAIPEIPMDQRLRLINSRRIRPQTSPWYCPKCRRNCESGSINSVAYAAEPAYNRTHLRAINAGGNRNPHNHATVCWQGYRDHPGWGKTF